MGSEQSSNLWISSSSHIRRNALPLRFVCHANEGCNSIDQQRSKVKLALQRVKQDGKRKNGKENPPAQSKRPRQKKQNRADSLDTAENQSHPGVNTVMPDGVNFGISRPCCANRLPRDDQSQRPPQQFDRAVCKSSGHRDGSGVRLFFADTLPRTGELLFLPLDSGRLSFMRWLARESNFSP